MINYYLFVVGCTGRENELIPSPRTIYELFSMAFWLSLIWFVEVDRGFLFFVVVAEECCGLGFGGQDNPIYTRGFSVLFRLTLLERPQSRFGDKSVKFQVVCPQNGTDCRSKGVKCRRA